MQHEYTIDREKYGLPAGPDDPQYTAQKWPLSKAAVHFREATKSFGGHVADLFAASTGGLQFMASGGFMDSALDAVADFDLVGSFKRMCSDGALKRCGREGTVAVYTNDALASSDTVNGLEHYYAGQTDVVMRLWWAMLCENTAPFAALHDRIAGVLQRLKPELSPRLSSEAM